MAPTTAAAAAAADEKAAVCTAASATTVPAPAPLIPEPGSQGDQPPGPVVAIEFPPASRADDPAFAGALAALVNAVYLEAEEGIFKPGYQRTTPSHISALVRAGELAVAFSSPSSNPTPIGCVAVRRASPTTGELGMLALDAAHRGRGLGRELALFAERACRAAGLAVLRLELLVPTAFEHAFKARLLAWYTRMGYAPAGGGGATGDFAADYPELAVLLAGPTEYRVFEKRLV